MAEDAIQRGLRLLARRDHDADVDDTECGACSLRRRARFGRGSFEDVEALRHQHRAHTVHTVGIPLSRRESSRSSLGW
jgi:hypothetical protein